MRGIYQLFFFTLLIQISLQKKSEQDKCKKSIEVRTFDSSKSYETICIECRTERRNITSALPQTGDTLSDTIEIRKVVEISFVLNDNYSQCLEIYPHPIQLDCRRVNERFTCQEAMQPSHVLKQNNYSIAQILNNKCAVITEDLSTCVMPKFGYTLILPSQQFQPMNQSFCAIQNQQIQKCIKYHHRFLPVKDKDYSVFFKDFYNFDKIDHELSHSAQIVCVKNYKLETINKVQGCFLNANSVENCIKLDEYRNCIQCKDGYAINAISEKCEQTTLDGCLIQNEQNNKQFCQKCKQEYILDGRNCKQIQNCEYQSQYPPFRCIACKYPFYGRNCQNSEDPYELCEIFEEDYDQGKGQEMKCLKCKNNEIQYIENRQKGDICKLRVESKNCQVKHPKSDQCFSIQQQDKLYYDGQYIMQQDFYKDPQLYGEKILKEQLYYENEYFQKIGVFNIDSRQSKITNIDGCEEYSLISDTCIKCKQGRNLWFQENKYICNVEEPKKNEEVGCMLLDQIKKKCGLCDYGYQLDNNEGKCLPNSITNCLVQQSSYCLKCKDGYIRFDQTCIEIPGYCKQINSNQCEMCFEGPSFMKTLTTNKEGNMACEDNIRNCKVFFSDQCIVCFNGFTLNRNTNECIKADKLLDCEVLIDLNTCERCAKNFKLDNSKKCIPIDQQLPICRPGEFPENCDKLSDCPLGYFISSNVCKQCPSNCQKCQNSEECQQCVSPYQLKDGVCQISCSFGWKANKSNQQCERICTVGTFLEYQTEKKEYQCKSVKDNQAGYCLQLIEQIPWIVQFKLSKVQIEDQNINLMAILNETPQQCFTYKLFGRPTFEIPIENTQNTNIHQTHLHATISKDSLLNPEKVVSNDKQSFLHLEIYFQEKLKYTAYVKIAHSFDLTLSNEIQYNVDNLAFDPLCEDCEVPVEKKVSSSTKAKCPSDTSCEDGKLSVYINSEIEITQSITDTKYQNNKLYPHSIKLKIINNGKESLSQIRNYVFDNSQVGKITYKFQAVGGQNGQLVVTSKVQSSVSGSRILQLSNSKEEVINSQYWYSTEVFDIVFKDEDDESNLGKSKIILICVSCGILTILLLLGIVYFVWRKRKQDSLKNSTNSLNTSYSNSVELITKSFKN